MSRVLGIDVSSFAIDFVLLDESDAIADWYRYDLLGKLAFDRLRHVADVMPQASFYDDVYLIAIETPKTRFLKSAGALFPVYGAVVAHLPAASELWNVHPKSWRLALGISGGASKDEAAAAARKLLDRPPLEDWPQDAWDALAVAYYAREVNRAAIEAA